MLLILSLIPQISQVGAFTPVLTDRHEQSLCIIHFQNFIPTSWQEGRIYLYNHVAKGQRQAFFVKANTYKISIFE